MYSVQELENLLNAAGADFQLIRQEVPILSAADAGPYYDVQKAAPTFILQSDRGLIACILSAGRGRMDFAAMRQRFGFSGLKMADRKKALRETGYQVGAIPLIGHGLDCIFDNMLLQYDYIYGGTGDPLVTLKIRPRDVKALNRVIGEM